MKAPRAHDRTNEVKKLWPGSHLLTICAAILLDLKASSQISIPHQSFLHMKDIKHHLELSIPAETCNLCPGLNCKTEIQQRVCRPSKQTDLLLQAVHHPKCVIKWLCLRPEIVNGVVLQSRCDWTFLQHTCMRLNNWSTWMLVSSTHSSQLYSGHPQGLREQLGKRICLLWDLQQSPYCCCTR